MKYNKQIINLINYNKNLNDILNPYKKNHIEQEKINLAKDIKYKLKERNKKKISILQKELNKLKREIDIYEDNYFVGLQNQCFKRLADRSYPDDFDLFFQALPDRAQIMFRHNTFFKAKACRFLDSLFAVRDRANFTGKTDFSEREHIIAQRIILQRRHKRHRNRQIQRGLVQFHSADDVDINICVIEKVSPALFKHSQQHRHSVIIKSVAHAARVAERCRRYKALNFRQKRP